MVYFFGKSIRGATFFLFPSYMDVDIFSLSFLIFYCAFLPVKINKWNENEIFKMTTLLSSLLPRMVLRLQTQMRVWHQRKRSLMARRNLLKMVKKTNIIKELLQRHLLQKSQYTMSLSSTPIVLISSELLRGGEYL